MLRSGWERLGRPPVVLNYHGLGSIPSELDPSNLFVEPERFRTQVEGLLGRGYEFVKLSEFADRLRERGAPPGICAITFDDGTLDNLEVLQGLAVDLGVPATVFVCSGLLGSPHPDLDPSAGVRLMTADELRELAAFDEIEIGSHTRLHRPLGDADEAQAYEEMVSSKRELEELVGRPVLSFAYPNGTYSAACPRAAERAGYKVAATCGLRGRWHPYELCRESITTLDGRVIFGIKSRGAWRTVRLSPPGRLAARLAPSRHHEPDVGWRRSREQSL